MVTTDERTTAPPGQQCFAWAGDDTSPTTPRARRRRAVQPGAPPSPPRDPTAATVLDVMQAHARAGVPRMRAPAAAVAMVLYALADPATLQVSASVDQLAAVVGRDRNAVRHALRDLAAAGLAVVVRPPSFHGPAVRELRACVARRL